MNIPNEFHSFIPTKSVFTIAKKEIMDNIRSRWVIVLSFIFALLTIFVSYFGSLGEGWQSLGFTIQGMMSLVQFLIPIIALTLSYGSVIGEIERGSMSAFLSFPLKRVEIILGKFLGLSSVLAISVLLGFGIAGIIIGINVGEINIFEFLFFLFSSILLGIVFICLGLFTSSFFKRRSTAMGMSVFIWFLFTMIWSIVISGIAFILVDSTSIMSDGFPDWFFMADMINPLSSYNALVTINIEAVSNLSQQFIGSYPEYYTTPLLTFILLLWILVFLFLSIRIFKNRDV